MWRKGITSVLLLCFVCVLDTGLAAPGNRNALNKQDPPRVLSHNPFTFDDIYNSTLDYRSFSVEWIDDGDAYLYHKDGDLVRFDIVADTTVVLVPKSAFEQVGPNRYYLSSDLSYVLFATEIRTLWRYSFLAKYTIYDISKQIWIDFPNLDGLRNMELQSASWAPSGHGLTFVSGNNLYYQADPISAAVQTTTDGDMKYIFNGIADWSYEEDVLYTYNANWISDDGSYVCYAKFNDTGVPLYSMPWYGDKSDVYGDIIEFTYPKAGYTVPGGRPTVALYVMDTSNPTGTHVRIPTPTKYDGLDHFLYRVFWRDPTSVTIVWSNHAQNEATVVVCGVSGQQCQENQFFVQAGGWVEGLRSVKHIESGAAYLTIMPKTVTGAGGWNHLAYVTSPVGASGVVTFLTDGDEEIKNYAGFDQVNNIVYYISTNRDALSRHLFKVGTPNAPIEDQTPVCLTCGLAPDCAYVSASFSSTGNYYIRSCRGPKIPSYFLVGTQNIYSEMKEDNADIEANMAEKDIPRIEIMQVPIAGGYNADVRIVVPPQADLANNTAKFPLIVDVYGGPGSQAVTHRYSTGGYDTYMASSENVVTAYIDGRGCTSRGNDFMFLVYRKLGTLEIDDQIAVASYLVQNIPYIDSALPVGIKGWSYGGYATSHALGNDSSLFGCGIVGAGYTDWRFYDYAYVERLMGFATPEDNEAGYNTAEVTRKVENFRNKKTLIIHGTADDNVHFGANVPLIKALQAAEIPFQMQLYPDKNHYNADGRHTYLTYTDFWLNSCWGQAVSQPTTPATTASSTVSQPPGVTTATAPTSLMSVGLIWAILVVWFAV